MNDRDDARVDQPPPPYPRELAAFLDAEERLGATDPFWQLRQLAHLILRKTVPPAGAAIQPSIRLGE